MTHEDYMREALKLAQEAMDVGEVPVGCVVVWDDKIIGRGRNRREQNHDALAHAELAAIKEACDTLGGWRLHRARLYVTLEPCPMCAGGILNARVAEVYYGAKDPKAGACGSILNLFEERFNHKPKLYRGLLEDASAQLLSTFFTSLRRT